MHKHFLTWLIEQYQGTNSESFTLMGSSFEINLEAIDWLVIKCRGADWTAFAAGLIAEHIPSRQYLPARLPKCFGLGIPEGCLCCLIPDHDLPTTIHCISCLAGAEKFVSRDHGFVTVFLLSHV